MFKFWLKTPPFFAISIKKWVQQIMQSTCYSCRLNINVLYKHLISSKREFPID